MEVLLFLALLGAVASVVGRGRHGADQPVTIYLVRPEPEPASAGGSFGVGLVVGIVLMLILVGAAAGG